MKTQVAEKQSLPLDPATGRPRKPMDHPGYYPGYSTLSQQNYWDAATRKVVLERVKNVPSIRFFTPDEAELLKAVCDRVLPQDDRTVEFKIPIVPFIDKRLHEGRIDGYRFEHMPPDREAHRLGLKAIEEIARHLFGTSFLELTHNDQEQVLRSIHDGKPAAGKEIWKRMPPHRYWMLLVQDCVEVYYAHPFAWDEIGYGGPAYPRAYMRLEGGRPEPWEVDEQRYEWEAPEGSISDRYEFIAGEGEHRGAPGQGGTH
jgi:hypothetical protein